MQRLGVYIAAGIVVFALPILLIGLFNDENILVSLLILSPVAFMMGLVVMSIGFAVTTTKDKARNKLQYYVAKVVGWVALVAFCLLLWFWYTSR